MQKKSATKFILEIVSSLGKGIAAASVGAILKSSGYKIGFPKIRPLHQLDPGNESFSTRGSVYY